MDRTQRQLVKHGTRFSPGEVGIVVHAFIIVTAQPLNYDRKNVME